MKRAQTAHETLVPLLVDLVGAQSYLELGTHQNETIRNVYCERRYGVDINFVACDGVSGFQMTTAEFIRDHAAQHAPYDVVFIDADHAAQSVFDDVSGIWPYVSAEGLVFLHDTNPETEADAAPGLCHDAWKFAQGLHRNGIESVTLPYHPGLTIARKREKWGP